MVNCPICDGALTRPLVKDLCVCSGCGHRRRQEIPTPEELKERTRHFQLSATKNKVTRKARLEDARHQLELLDCPPGNVYDVGAAAGFFLKVARDAGWGVWGNEISVSAIEWARRHYEIWIGYGLLEEIAHPPEFIDAVVIWNTLEHCINPLTTLQAAHHILKPGGVLLVSVPIKRDEELKPSYAAAHLSEFTQDSLELCAVMTGFQPSWIRTRQSRICRQADGRWVKQEASDVCSPGK